MRSRRYQGIPPGVACQQGMRVVLDCNVLISAGRTNGTCRKVVRKSIRHHEIVISEQILFEYIDVIDRNRTCPFYSTLKSLYEEIEHLAVVVKPVNLESSLSDSSDEVYLATATAGEAALITGNKNDFTEPLYGQVEVWG